MEQDPLLRGVTVEKAQELLPALLKQYRDNVFFRHVPFDHVLMRSYSELLDEAVAAGAVVGFGLNFSRFTPKTEVWRHVCRYSGEDAYGKLILIDDAADTNCCPLHVEWPDLETAVHDVRDGFWLIGSSQVATLKYAPLV